MIVLTRTQIVNWYIKASQKQDVDLRRFATMVINADDELWNRIQFAAVKIMNDPVYNQAQIKYSKSNVVTLPDIEVDVSLKSMRSFYRIAKAKGNIHLQRFATLYLNCSDRMFQYLFVAAYFLMKDNELKMKILSD